ncbi:serine hydrolase domain-containing protein [Shimazuella kribbensis]|uniref:serine hydrolase domain-containing protein n=1 Tax=Shimazuella kribbensis TaxID=139808 RepID=UPI001471E059|nr:serine hydrolase domain-containing protein [Shimazuella kribbensis]
MKNKNRILMVILAICLLTVLPWGKAGAQGNMQINKIDKFIQNNMKNYKIPGLSVAITYQGKVVFTKGYGQTSDHQKVTADTPFAIASLSKAFTALAVIQLAEAGKLELDRPVITYLPYFKLADPRGDKITVRHLLQHTSGLTDGVNPDMTRGEQPKTLSEVISHLQDVSLASEPGQEYHYHNPNYQILARLVEVISKEDFGAYLKRHIFQPLEMKNTTHVSSTSQLKKLPNFSEGHHYLFGQPLKTNEPDWFVAGPAGMVSTANDMAKWLAFQLNNGNEQTKQILSANGLKQTHSSIDPKVNYGLGWNIGKTKDGKQQISHGGIFWTYKAEAEMLPDDGIGVVVLFNSGLNSFVDYTSFTRGIAALLMNQSFSKPISNQWYEIGMGIAILVTILLGIRTLMRTKHWNENRKYRAQWKNWFYLSLRFIPLVLLISFSPLLSFIGGGRVLTWQGIYYTMPSIIILLVTLALIQLIIFIQRLFYLYNK